ncbi:MAG: zinc ribbon domain-containing protein [Anaerolineales bacterium]|nr:zinc ribbon domain-containing protein [Anaerolineales bacterium]
MKNIWKWILGIVLVLVVFFGLGILSRFIGPQYAAYGWHTGRMPMMGYGISSFGFMPFGMIFMWLIPLAFLVMLVLGILWAVKALKGTQAPAPGRACAQCGKAVQLRWKNCPYCGNSLW